MSTLTVVAFQETDARRWVAQCLEYDICASAESLAELPGAFNAAVEGHKLICKAEGIEPFESLPEAPARYRRMYEEASGQYKPIRDPLPIRLHSYELASPRFQLAAAV